MSEVEVGKVYKHYKGDLYLVESIAFNSETEEKMVIYRALYGENKLWCRPYSMFVDVVNKNNQKYRFEKMDIKSVREEK